MKVPELDGLFTRFMFGLTVFFFVLLLLAFAGFTYNTIVAKKLVLRSDDWKCVSSHVEYTWAGKTPIISTVCDSYVRTP